MSSADVIDLCSDKEDEQGSAKKRKVNHSHEKDIFLMDEEESPNIDNKVTIKFTTNNNNKSMLCSKLKQEVTCNDVSQIITEKPIEDESKKHEKSIVDYNDENLLMVLRTESLDAPQDTYDHDSNDTEPIILNSKKPEASSPASVTLQLSPDHMEVETDSIKDDDDKATSTNQLKTCFKMPKELEAFIMECKRSIKRAKLDKKLSSFRSKAKQASVYVQSEEFLTDLAEFKKKRKAENLDLSYVLVDVYNKFKEKKNSEEVEDKRLLAKIDMLSNKLNKIKEKIDKLAEEEVDFDEEENSSYIQYLKYCERADLIVKKIAQLQKSNPYAGIAYFSRLDFSKSQYQEFNIAINKKYRNREQHTFPTYYELDKILRKCIKKHNLQLKESDIKAEVKFCFEQLGKLLKKRRQKDLECIHLAVLPSSTDPAKTDPKLEEKLRQHKTEAGNKLSEVLQKFSRMQDTNVDPDLSEDSDDSKHEASDNCESGSD